MNMLAEKSSYHKLAKALESNYKKLSELKNSRGTWEAAWRSIEPRTDRASESDLEDLEKNGMELTLRDDAGYPDRLREIPFSPHGIYSRGRLQEDKLPTVAIVGTRRASDAGKTTAREFAKGLANKGVIVISGLALGIDAAAHRGALEGGGKTIAVLGNGADKPYPNANRELADKILEEGGAIISEYPPGSPSLPYRFLERNRIVSGLSDAVLVIEAPIDSGALVTARFAMEQNRDVMVVPGPARDPHFSGSHKLIREGAELVTSLEEILERFDLENSSSTAKNYSDKKAPESKEESLILEALEKFGEPAEIDKIAETTKLTSQVVSRTVSFLIIRGLIRETERGYAISQ